MEAPGYVDAILCATDGHLASPASIERGRVTDWSMLRDHAAGLAAGLRRAGVQSGDRVAVLSFNCDRYMALYLAIPWAGAVITPLNPRWSADENRYALADCEPRAIVVGEGIDTAAIELVAQHVGTAAMIWAARTPCPDGWLSYDEMLSAQPIENSGRRGDDLLGIFYTGGTTGRAKGVMLSHAGLLGNCAAIRQAGMFPAECRGLVVAPLFHLAAAAVMTCIMLASGTAVILGNFDPDDTLATIDAEGVTDALLVPTMIQMLLDAPNFEPARVSGLRRVIYGASPIAEMTLDRMMIAAPGVDFYQAYGMTEVSCAATILRPEFHLGEHRAAGRHRSAGTAVAYTEIMIADTEGHPVPTGEVGEILVRGGGVMLGYWNQPELTREALRNGWMHTGDGGRADELGLVYVVDRLKDMIVSGGENVYSGEVESALAKHPAIAQCAVIGVPDERWGERVHAVIVLRAAMQADTDEIIAHCRRLIAGYKCPRSVDFVSKLPITAAGKILKSQLRAPFWEGREKHVA